MMKRFRMSSENITAIIFFMITFIMPFMFDAYTIDNFSNFYVTILISLSLTMIWGFTGIFSFGQAVFYGFGAYTYAIISIAFKSSSISTVAAVLAAVAVAGIVAAVLGYFIFYGRISSAFTGIITMSIATVMELFMTQTSDGKWKILGVPLGGFNGLNKIPAIQVGNFRFKGVAFFFLATTILLLVYLLIRHLEKSNFGYSLFGIRENKDRCEMFGYDIAKNQTIIFSASGALAGLAGALFASWSGYVVPSNFGVNASTVAVIMVAVAGRKNPTGAVVMTWIYCWFTQKLATTGSEYSQLILGALLIICVLFIPDGVMVAFFKKLDKLFLKKSSDKETETLPRGGAE